MVFTTPEGLNLLSLCGSLMGDVRCGQLSHAEILMSTAKAERKAQSALEASDVSDGMPNNSHCIMIKLRKEVSMTSWVHDAFAIRGKTKSLTSTIHAEQRTHHQITGEQKKLLSIANHAVIVETELFAQTHKSYGLATAHYPVLEIEAKVEPFENGRDFSLRALRAGKPRRKYKRERQRLRSKQATIKKLLKFRGVVFGELERCDVGAEWNPIWRGKVGSS